MGTTATNQCQQTLFKIGVVEKEISFHEEKLSEFKSIQLDFKHYISQTFASFDKEVDPRLKTSEWQPDFLMEGKYGIELKRSFWYKDPAYLDNFLQVLIKPDAGYDHPEAAERQIAGFEDFICRRLEGSIHGIGEKELRLIRKVELAISFYNEHNYFYFYHRFRKALAEYFIWLERKIYKSTLYITCLHRILTGSGIVVDFRQLLRAIMRFLCRRLDDEHSVDNKISNILSNYFYWLTCVNYEYRIYKSSN